MELAPITNDSPTSDYLEEETGVETGIMAALPVTVVEPVRVEDRPARSITTRQAVLDASPDIVAPERAPRVSVTLTNVGAGTAYVSGARVTANADNGFPLRTNETITLKTCAEVWAVSPAGTTLAILALHRDG